jgi:hypothetical protein
MPCLLLLPFLRVIIILLLIRPLDWIRSSDAVGAIGERMDDCGFIGGTGGFGKYGYDGGRVFVRCGRACYFFVSLGLWGVVWRIYIGGVDVG